MRIFTPSCGGRCPFCTVLTPVGIKICLFFYTIFSFSSHTWVFCIVQNHRTDPHVCVSVVLSKIHKNRLDVLCLPLPPSKKLDKFPHSPCSKSVRVRAQAEAVRTATSKSTHVSVERDDWIPKSEKTQAILLAVREWEYKSLRLFATALSYHNTSLWNNSKTGYYPSYRLLVRFSKTIAPRSYETESFRQNKKRSTSCLARLQTYTSNIHNMTRWLDPLEQNLEQLTHVLA